MLFCSCSVQCRETGGRALFERIVKELSVVSYHNSLNFQRFPINEHGTVRLWTDLEIVGTGEPVCVGDWILPA